MLFPELFPVQFLPLIQNYHCPEQCTFRKISSEPCPNQKHFYSPNPNKQQIRAYTVELKSNNMAYCQIIDKWQESHFLLAAQLRKS